MFHSVMVSGPGPEVGADPHSATIMFDCCYDVLIGTV